MEGLKADLDRNWLRRVWTKYAHEYESSVEVYAAWVAATHPKFIPQGCVDPLNYIRCVLRGLA